MKLIKGQGQRMDQLAWHYTTGDHFKEIVESGLLMTTSAGCPDNERPIVWFSMNQWFEPTATKMVFENSRPRSLTMQETKTFFNGLVRFGYPPLKLIPWHDLPKLAGITRHVKRGLEKAGRLQGATPHHWMGSFQAISVDDLVIEVMNDQNQWQRVQDVLDEEWKQAA